MFHQDISWGVILCPQPVLHESDQDPCLWALLSSLHGSFNTDLSPGLYVRFRAKSLLPLHPPSGQYSGSQLS